MANNLNYSDKLRQAAANPLHRGALFPEDAAEKGMALVEAKSGNLKIYWLVIPGEDRIYSAKFFTYGGVESIAIGETLCAMTRGLTIKEAESVTGKDVERALRDEAETPSAQDDKISAFGAVDDIIKSAAEAYPAAKAVAMASAAARDSGAGAPSPDWATLTEKQKNWLSLSREEQIKKVESALDERVRDFLRFEGGDVAVLDVVDGKKVIVQYQGSCGSCASSTGATLSMLEQTLRMELFDELVVIPNF